MKTLVYSPVFNQVNELPLVLGELYQFKSNFDELLLINNGSSDGSEEIVRGSGVNVIDLPQNRGVGFSMIKAIEWALENDFEIICGIASNGKMLAHEIPRLTNPIVSNEADYVKGSRFLKGGNYPNLPIFRRWSIPLVSLLASLLTAKFTTDATCGFRAFKVDLFKKTSIAWKQKWLYGYSFEYFIDAKIMCSHKARYKEVPVTMRYPQFGPYTKIKGISSWLEMLRPWFYGRLKRGSFYP